ncbi:MAG TPA: hypothetical protein VG097_00840 [Gemmata sp.]|jgi:hypothetical protein|nr:hypothetical protein [Gemmata sp.]
MFRPLSLVLLVLLVAACFWGWGWSPDLEAKADDQKFTFDSVKYTEDGKTQTSKFKDGRVQISAATVKNEIIIQGSYGPDDPTVTTLVVGIDLNITPIFKDGKWTATIDADKLETNVQYRIKAKAKEREIAKADLLISVN